jgi:hypothetical protein
MNNKNLLLIDNINSYNLLGKKIINDEFIYKK